jgi:hypothetical protein
MSIQAPAGEDVIKAWNAYAATPQFANSKHWVTNPAHTEGSMWACFEAGYAAGVVLPVPKGRGEIHDLPHVVLAAVAGKVRLDLPATTLVTADRAAIFLTVAEARQLHATLSLVIGDASRQGSK